MVLDRSQGRGMNLIRTIRRLVREIEGKLQCICSTEGKINFGSNYPEIREAVI